MGVEKIDEPLDDSRLWTKEDACRFLGCGKSTLYVMIQRREIPHLKVNNRLRFVPEQLRAWAIKQTKNQD